jgi:hypothetical protein
VWDYWGSDQWVITPRTNEKLLSNAVVGIPGGLVLVSTEWQEGYLSWGFRTPSTYETAWGAEDSTRLPTNTLTLPSEASGLIWAIGTIGSRINVILKTDVSGGGSRHEALGFLINPLTEMYLPYRLVFTGGNSTWGIHQDFDRIIDGDTLHFINDGPDDNDLGYSVYYGSAELPDTLTPIPEDPSITIDGWAQWPATIEQAWYQPYDFNPPPDEEGGTVVGLVDHLDDNWVYAHSGHWVKPVRHFVEQFGELE